MHLTPPLVSIFKTYDKSRLGFIKNAKKVVSYCTDCKNTAFAAGCVIVIDYKYFGYYEILDAIRDNGEEGNKPISFEEAVRRAFNRTENVSYNGSGA